MVTAIHLRSLSLHPRRTEPEPGKIPAPAEPKSGCTSRTDTYSSRVPGAKELDCIVRARAPKAQRPAQSKKRDQYPNTSAQVPVPSPENRNPTLIVLPKRPEAVPGLPGSMFCTVSMPTMLIIPMAAALGNWPTYRDVNVGHAIAIRK